MDSILLEEPSFSPIYSAGGGSGGGGRAIDRHNPIIRDEKRLGQGSIFPSISTTTNITADHYLRNKMPPEVEKEEEDDQKRKSVASANYDDEFIKGFDFISPASSSRCLLSDHRSKFNNFSSQLKSSSKRNSHNGNALKIDDLLLSSVLPPAAPQLPPPPPYDGDDEQLPSSPPKPPPSPPREPLKCLNSKVCNEKHHDPPSSVAPKPTSPPPSSDQVVVLEVSLHCRGCERKMKKHISKIEGVTSFKIDFAAKTVTVVGDVTPLAVLTSVLKVKNAKLLTPATISSSSSQTGSNG